MVFARRVFAIAGTLGLLTVVPLFFLFDRIGADYPPPITHPEFYWGFLSVTVAWQIAFLIIAMDPIRYRPLMIAGMVEKFGYVAAMVALHLDNQVGPMQLAPSGLDLIYGVLFVMAYVKTRR